MSSTQQFWIQSWKLSCFNVVLKSLHIAVSGNHLFLKQSARFFGLRYLMLLIRWKPDFLTARRRGSQKVIISSYTSEGGEPGMRVTNLRGHGSSITSWLFMGNQIAVLPERVLFCQIFLGSQQRSSMLLNRVYFSSQQLLTKLKQMAEPKLICLNM